MTHPAAILRLLLPAAAAPLAALAATLLCTTYPHAWLVLIPAAAWLPVSILLLRHATRSAVQAEAAHQEIRAHRRVDQLCLTRRDVLTGLSNRQGFLETLSTHLAAAKPFAVLVIDLDGFDATNANLGEAAGDEILCSFGRRLRDCAKPDRLARLDGDSFGLILADPADLKHPAAATARILAALSEPYAVAGELVDAPASIGAAIACQHGTTPETLLRAARETTLRAKQTGGGRALICGAEFAEMVMTRQTSRRDMQRAIEAGQFVAYYQPIVRLPEGGIAKFEVLARWMHPKHGMLLPDQFIPLADEMGLAGQISMALLRRMATDTEGWPSWCRFAINISAGQVRETISLLKTQPGDWQRRIDLTRLDVEMAECALMRDPALAAELIDALHDQGARAVLDNFGSGTSNFFHLQSLAFDAIKIGKDFVRTLATDARMEACVASMLSLGAGLDIDIIADGVETEDVAIRLTNMGCELVQGFLYAHPMPAAEAGQLLGRQTITAEAA